MENSTFRIDVHHHFMPDVFYDAQEETAALSAGGVPTAARWSPEQSLGKMDEFGIRAAILSCPSLNDIHRKFPHRTAGLARSINEYAAELHERFPSRFGSFAVLPLPLIDESITELEYALDVLKLDGVGLASNYDSLFLGNPELETVFQELNKRKAVLFVHPSVPDSSFVRPKFIHIDSILEFPTNTARAALNLVYGGAMERFPDLEIILAHAGGTLPYLKFRIFEFQRKYTHLDELFREECVSVAWKSLKKSTTDYLAQFWYDNCTSTDPVVFEAIKNITGDYRFVFGTDIMFAADFIREDMINIIDNYGFTEEEKNNMNYGFAARLFPRFS